MNGTITTIFHDYTGRIGAGAGIAAIGKGAKFYSALYIKVGRKELALIRPNGRRFNWKGKGEIHSGDCIRITLEIVPRKGQRK